MDRRYAVLLASGLRKIEPGGDFGLHVVAIDELAFYMRGGTKDERTELTETLRDLISRGRAAGMIVIAATQKPSNDIVPTFVRDLFSLPHGAALHHTRGLRHHPRARAGPRRATRPRPWIRRPGGSAACWPRGRCRSRSAPTTSTTTPSPIWPTSRSHDGRRRVVSSAVALAGAPGRSRPGRPVLEPGPAPRASTSNRATGRAARRRSARPVQGPPGRRVPVVLPPLSKPTPGSWWPPASGAARASSPRGRAPPALRHPDRSLLRAGAHRVRRGPRSAAAGRRRRIEICRHGVPVLCRPPRRGAMLLGEPLCARVLRLPGGGAVERPRAAAVGHSVTPLSRALGRIAGFTARAVGTSGSRT